MTDRPATVRFGDIGVDIAAGRYFDFESEPPFGGVRFEYLDQPGVFPTEEQSRASLQRLLIEAGVHEDADCLIRQPFEIGGRHVRLVLYGKPADLAHNLLAKFHKFGRLTIGRFQRRDLPKREAGHER